ncbi:MAG TPA: F0F1 ATP synthase subunit B' [Dongiaceae bacterium]|jgi:F-type H+-transporting ATPase subunit b|nr:F0F1 ATP synthase subunit B' [Dongiaceae bacterium]
MPQLDPAVFLPQLVWLAITFLALYLLMSYIALPRVAKVLGERNDRIEGNIERAERLKEEAQAALKAYEAELASARAQAQETLRRAAAEIAAETQGREQAFAHRIKEETQSAEKRISSAKVQALKEMETVTHPLAERMVEKLLG